MLKRLSWLLLGVLTAACQRQPETQVVRLGFFPNVTHAQALVGHHQGTFARALGSTRLEFKQFNAGPTAMEALLGGSVDLAYVGAGPAINTYLRAGRQLRVVAGAVNGGALLVTRTARSASELQGKKLAAPQLGNSQDIALRHWLAAQGVSATVYPVSNPEILSLFRTGRLEGAWVPEPWASRLIAAGGQVLVDERDLWPQGEFPTTLLVTTERFLKTHRAQAQAVVEAHLALTEAWRRDPAGFRGEVNGALAALTSHRLPPELLEQAFARMRPAVRPPLAALKGAALHAQALGYTSAGEVDGMVDLSLLPPVESGRALRPLELEMILAIPEPGKTAGSLEWDSDLGTATAAERALRSEGPVLAPPPRL